MPVPSMSLDALAQNTSMDRWIARFLEINQDHPDPSDYEKFFTCFRGHLLANPGAHKEAGRILVQALAAFRSTPLLSITYRLLHCIDAQVEVPEPAMAKHFRDPCLRRHIFPLVQKLDLSLFDSKLRRLLYRPHYECPGFFGMMRDRREWALEFLAVESRALARKQMMLMIHTGIFHKMDYFIGFLGSRDRSLSFLAFEALKLFTDGIADRIAGDARAEPVLLHDGRSFGVWSNPEGVWISLEPRLEVECPTNFLIHFADFAFERNVLLRLVAARDREGVETILARYAVFDMPLQLPDPRWLVPAAKCGRAHAEEQQQDVCFEYLFSGETYKDTMDCIEI